MLFRCLLLLMLFTIGPTAHAGKYLHTAITQPIPLGELSEYRDEPNAVQTLIQHAQQLSQKKLTYLFGSADPRNRGLDCSGTIHYLLKQQAIHNAPRQSDELYNWVQRNGTLHKVSNYNFNSSDFSKLKPGDLLFWSGTYHTHRSSPISHVMLYLGKNKAGQPLMFGSSSGRTYKGKRIRGVSVFDFKLPSGRGKQQFVGYGCIPHLTCR